MNTIIPTTLLFAYGGGGGGGYNDNKSGYHGRKGAIPTDNNYGSTGGAYGYCNYIFLYHFNIN